MMFIGFGFLMTFLKRYGYGAVGLNFIIAAFVLEWSILVRGWLEAGINGEADFTINVKRYLNKKNQNSKFKIFFLKPVSG